MQYPRRVSLHGQSLPTLRERLSPFGTRYANDERRLEMFSLRSVKPLPKARQATLRRRKPSRRVYAVRRCRRLAALLAYGNAYAYEKP